MNTDNLEYLKDRLLNLGFGDKANDELEKQINPTCLSNLTNHLFSFFFKGQLPL